MTDRAWRLAYRLGFRLCRAWWRLRRPAHRGALVAVWVGGRVLMLRLSYRHALNFPGGGLRRGETAQDAALRELAEEVGLVVPRARLRLVRSTLVAWDHRRDRVRIFELRLAAEPALAIDRREVVGAAFMTPAEALRHSLPPHIRDYLRARPDGAPACGQESR